MSLPNFLIAGVIKSGSTTLYHYLKRHPEVFLPEVKEPNFFASQVWQAPMFGLKDNDDVVNQAVNNWEDYQALYAGSDKKAAGDLSVNTFYFGLPAVEEVRKRLGDVKILIILRNPVKRTHSAYLHMVRDNKEPLTFEQALLYEEIRLRKPHAPMWGYKKASLYADTLKLWMDNFSRVKVLINQDLAEQPERFITEVMEFLEVDPNIEFEELDKFNTSGVPQNKLLHNIMMDDSFLKSAVQPIKKIIPTEAWKNMVERVKASNLKKPGMAPTTKKYLQEYFKEDIGKVEELLNRDLSIWRK